MANQVGEWDDVIGHEGEVGGVVSDQLSPALFVNNSADRSQNFFLMNCNVSRC